jgi:hypothetical protein
VISRGNVPDARDRGNQVSTSAANRSLHSVMAWELTGVLGQSRQALLDVAEQGYPHLRG